MKHVVQANTQENNKLNQKDIKVLSNLPIVEIFSLTQIGVFRRVFLAIHLASTDNLTVHHNECIGNRSTVTQ